MTNLIVIAQETKQHQKQPFPFREFSLSLNRTNVSQYHAEDRLGFGTGMYAVFRPSKKLNPLIGIEYNLTRQFVESEYRSHFSSNSDVTYIMHNISIPFSIRCHFGNKVQFFVEPGIFVNLMVGSRKKGTYHSDFGPPSSFNESAGSDRNFGPQLGIGSKIPLGKVEAIVKVDYKFTMPFLYNDDIYNNYFRLMVGVRIPTPETRAAQ